MESVKFDGSYKSIQDILVLVREDRNAYHLKSPPYPLMMEKDESNRISAISRLITGIKENKFSFSREYIADILEALKEPEGVQIIEHSGSSGSYFLYVGDSLVREDNNLRVERANSGKEQ